MSRPQFVHLHVHSDYSILDGVTTVEEICRCAAERQMKAVALTDHGNMFAAVEFYRTAKKHGLKPIIGMEAYVVPSLDDQRDKGYNHLTLLAKNETGYRNLMSLSSGAYIKGFYRKPRMDHSMLAECSEGIIALSGCPKGEIASSLVDRGEKAAQEKLGTYLDIFGRENFFLEMQSVGFERNDAINSFCLDAASRNDLKCVATNDVHYLNRDDHQLQDVILAIGTNRMLEDSGRFRITSDQLWLRTPQEMAETFPDNPEALSNTLLVADMCELELELDPTRLHLPRFNLPEGFQDADQYLRELSKEGLKERMGGEPPDGYRERIEHELSIIKEMGFSGYFLIVRDIVHAARRLGVGVGPGRGSAAGSLVLFGLGVTSIDPIRYNLLFERFLNPDRVSPPDVDLDFEDTGRGKLLEHISETYGSDSVAQIVTFGRMLSRQAVKDVGRVLGFSFAEMDRLAKMIPYRLGITIEEAVNESAELRERINSDEKLAQLFHYARRIEGRVRNTSKHAAGVVIAPGGISRYAPLLRSDEDIITQYEMHSLEQLGLMKVDILGLRTITIIKRAQELIRKSKPDFDIEKVPLDDENTFGLLASGKTFGCFQLESAGMRRVLLKLSPSCLEDISAVIALYRPGPIETGVIDRFCDRKQGKEKVAYDFDELRPVLDETHGTCVYQEQIMGIARVLAGFSLARADTLRKAMGKKDPEVMARVKEDFVEGCAGKGHTGSRVEKLWEEIVKFAGYAFNKSHSTAYALVAYRTAYLKANFPAEFFAATLTAEMNTQKFRDKGGAYIKEARSMGLELLGPDVNSSDGEFSLEKKNTIRYGLLGVKNVGKAAVDEILKARSDGPYTGLEDFVLRVNNARVNKKTTENLIKSGGFDWTGRGRDEMFNSLKKLYGSGFSQETGAGLFGSMGFEVSTPDERTETPLEELLAYEQESLGFYLSTHPLEIHRGLVEALGATSTVEVSEMEDGDRCGVAAAAISVARRKTKRGKSYVAVGLEDFDGALLARVWLDDAERPPDVQVGRCYFVRGRVMSREEGDARSVELVVQEMKELGAPDFGSGLVFRCVPSQLKEEDVMWLQETLAGFPGESDVLFLFNENDSVRSYISGAARVELSDRLLSTLSGLPGHIRVYVRP